MCSKHNHQCMCYKQVRVGDPTFLGYFMDTGVAAAAKVVRKVRSFQFMF